MEKIILTDGTKNLLKLYAEDACNWNGTPLIGGNVKSSQENNGYLLSLKMAGLITTDIDEEEIWLSFTDEGKQYIIKEFGIEI